MLQQVIAILDFGSQYGQLIARRVREQNVYSQIFPADISAEKLKSLNLKGIILSGGPASVYDENAIKCDEEIFQLGVPVLGICYGMQLGCKILGCKISPAEKREYGRTKLKILDNSDLFADIDDEIIAWASHSDQIDKTNDGIESLAETDSCPFAAVRDTKRNFYGVQFHPEVSHTPQGSTILENFLYKICKCEGGWQMKNLAADTIEKIRSQVGGSKVLCGLSGGVDSSVTAALLNEAVGRQLVCIFVDNGLLRKNERRQVESTFADHFKLDLRIVDWSKKFLKGLKGVTDPQEKRKVIGGEFIKAFESEAKKIPAAEFLAQGTLYPDVIESGNKDGNKAASIKLHHNVGGLPEKLGFKLVEPLRDFFKDEVRKMGEYLGLPENMIWRHPFPGPGLAVRIIGEVTEKRLEILRQADDILISEIKSANLYRKVSQTLAVLVPISTIGVMGDERSYENVIAVRSVDTTDFMTADFSQIPYEVLGNISNRIINEVRGVNRVVYDISSKPPATIEWE